jgi:hypothetical protein
MIADRTMSVGPEWRRQPFVETEAIVRTKADASMG